MANTSATGGYLTPTSTAPLDDDALLDFLHDVLQGVTGLPANMVRPAYQANPPKRPGIATNWIGFFTSNHLPEAGNAYLKIAEDGESSQQIRHETFDMRISAYGPASAGYAAMIRDGLEIAQNREILYLAGMAYVDASAIVSLGDLVDELWYRRSDITLTFRRELGRDYAILSLLGADGTINTETTTVNWAVSPEV
jgi:hypothetical protein